jgi:hypothetical protein
MSATIYASIGWGRRIKAHIDEELIEKALAGFGKKNDIGYVQFEEGQVLCLGLQCHTQNHWEPTRERLNMDLPQNADALMSEACALLRDVLTEAGQPIPEELQIVWKYDFGWWMGCEYC